MPRDGSNIYSQPFPDVVEDTTIESTVYNGFTNDVAADLNAARPIVAGGTGATNADQALFNLAAEKATQVVTNYDSHLWVPGSFRSAAGATGAPTVNAFAGTAIIGEALANPPTNQNVVLEARDLGDASVPGLKYIREKTAGVWSAWALDVGSQAIRYDADQNLTEVQKAQGRENIYAAPFDALAYNGMQINGSMDVSQEKGTTATVIDGYICDGWAVSHNGTMVMSGAQALNGTLISGIPNCLVITVTTAQASLSAGHLATLQTKIEGYRAARLGFGTAGAGSVTVAFWTAHARQGLFSVSIRNGTGTRSCTASYTQNVSNTWEYKTVTFPGCTDGGWANDNATGLLVDFSLAAGTTFTAPAAGTWYSTNYVAAPGQINAVAATSDVFRITGVVVLPGIEVPSAARSPLIMRPFDQELITCKRYWQSNGSVRPIDIYWVSPAAASIGGGSWVLPVEMRSTPVLVVSDLVGNTNKVTVYDAAGSAVNNQTINTSSASSSIFGVRIYSIGGAVGMGFNYKLDARL